jgi:4-phospho-D-threonate 3-dehydrogenase / 4-phospho-D-erythronate 3-dehydrogenase
VTILPTVAPEGPIRTGEVTAEGGRQAHDAVVRATALAMEGQVRAIVTAPLNKEALNSAGYNYAGHTELLAELTGARDSVMLLAHGRMRVSHVTTHIALSDVPGQVTSARIRRVVELTSQALMRLGTERRRIAVAALNPHAGEGGLFGRQDIDVTQPTVEALAAEGYDVVGPIPGDTVFVKLRAGSMTPSSPCTMTRGIFRSSSSAFPSMRRPANGMRSAGSTSRSGLPIVRTSVDHGTAFDIAGQGIAEEGSMLEAIDMALELSAG